MRPAHLVPEVLCLPAFQQDLLTTDKLLHHSAYSELQLLRLLNAANLDVQADVSVKSFEKMGDPVVRGVVYTDVGRVTNIALTGPQLLPG